MSCRGCRNWVVENLETNEGEWEQGVQVIFLVFRGKERYVMSY